MSVDVGTVFSTGNSTVAQLAVGTMLRVSAKGQLEVVEGLEEKESHEAGDDVETHHGHSTVVRMTSRFEDLSRVVNGEAEGFLYIADDGEFVVRVQLTD